MNNIILASATWLHLLATVTVIGLYLVMYWAVTPAALAAPAHAAIVHDAYRRSKPFVLVAWLIFIVTGITLMFLNPEYKGIGQFDNPWSILMLVKHIVVLALIMLSGMINVCPFIGLMPHFDSALKHDDQAQVQSVLSRIHSRELWAMLLGLLVLLLTAAAELS